MQACSLNTKDKDVLRHHHRLVLRRSELDVIIAYLWKCISMCCNDGNVSILRVRVVERCVLLDSKVQRIVLMS